MKYPVILIKSDEGFAVSCPALPGCWSQGSTQAEALTNIREAIQLWLEVAEEDARREAESEIGTLAEVTV
jgi:predicted RNase H-like HicB family nuclease